MNALVQEVIPSSQFTGANAAVLIGVQSGMLLAGAFVGFVYDHTGIAGILAIDGATYFVSSFCLYQVRSGYVSPRRRQTYPHEFSEETEATAEALETGANPGVAEAGLTLTIYSDLKEGFAYLKQQANVRALGVTHAVMMASVVSANVVLVALANDVIHRGALGLGFIEAGWACGAVIGGLLASQLPPKLRLTLYVAAFVVLSTGHPGAAVRIVFDGSRGVAGGVWIQPRGGGRGGAIVADVHCAAPLYGAHAIGDRDTYNGAATGDEFFPWVACAAHQSSGGIRAAGVYVRWRFFVRIARAAVTVASFGIAKSVLLIDYEESRILIYTVELS